MNYKISLIVPCFGRPQRTIRAIECVMNQDFAHNWEAYFIGDNCPDLQKIIDDGMANTYIELAKSKGNKLAIFNLPFHYGKWGYECRSIGFRLTEALYIMFMDNDDMIKTNHFSNYYNAIANTKFDLVYFDTWLDPIPNENGGNGKLRQSKMEFGFIGHQEVIVRSSLLKLYRQKPIWGHDWEMINDLLKNGILYQKSFNPPTYHIMSVGELREQGID